MNCLISINIILEGDAHHGPKSADRKPIIRMFIDPLKKRLAEYLKFFKTKSLSGKWSRRDAFASWGIVAGYDIGTLSD
jgi:hypothetical protein